MDSIIGLREANCKNCYKCIRNCPVKSIEYKDEKVHIMSDECIYCGKCLLVCPQNAKYINSDLYKVRNAIHNGEKLYVSLAPSYIAAFPNSNILKMSEALKKLGFAHVEETAVGAAQVTREYEKLISAKQMKNIITTACPSVNLLVEKYYPELIAQLAPVVTPAVAHSRMLRQVYGPRIKVVFIGPCVSKKFECIDPENGNSLFAVLTFNELDEWFKQEKTDFSKDDSAGRTLVNILPRCYPIPGGIIRNLSREERHKYECVSADGASRCMEILDSISNEGLSGYFLELNICPGGCLGGPSLQLMGKSYLSSKSILFKNMRTPNSAPPVLTEGVKAQFGKSFRDRSVKRHAVSEEKIHEVLAAMGKTSPEKELNCGCCGYDTCREKAAAVINGKADIRMCVPHMRELAESMSSTVVENCPIGVLILNDKLIIDHINPAAAIMLKTGNDVVGHSIVSLLDSGDFYEAMSENKNIINHKQYYKSFDMFVEQSVVWVEDSKILFVLIKDITSEEKGNEERRKFAEDSASFAHEVVNRQMQAVQEIANLLGETTVQTQNALSKLTATLLKNQDGRQHDYDKNQDISGGSDGT
jgi:iron only hydrogenase large subunit-like protein/uncharacterized Fe-S cluster-containing protein